MKSTSFRGSWGKAEWVTFFSIEQKSGNLKFALKFLQHYIPDDNYHRSLINEWETAQKINHKNTIRYHGFHDGLHYMRRLIVGWMKD